MKLSSFKLFERKCKFIKAILSYIYIFPHPYFSHASLAQLAAPREIQSTDLHVFCKSTHISVVYSQSLAGIYVCYNLICQTELNQQSSTSTSQLHFYLSMNNCNEFYSVIRDLKSIKGRGKLSYLLQLNVLEHQ